MHERQKMRRARVYFVQGEVHFHDKFLVGGKAAHGPRHGLFGAGHILRLDYPRRRGIPAFHGADGYEPAGFPPAVFVLRTIQHVIAEPFHFGAETSRAVRIGLYDLELPPMEAVVWPTRKELVAHQARIHEQDERYATAPKGPHRLGYALFNARIAQVKTASRLPREDIDVEPIPAKGVYPPKDIRPFAVNVDIAKATEQGLGQDPARQAPQRFSVVLAIEPLKDARSLAACGRHGDRDGKKRHPDSWFS